MNEDLESVLRQRNQSATSELEVLQINKFMEASLEIKETMKMLVKAKFFEDTFEKNEGLELF